MKSIHKYPLEVTEEQMVGLPLGWVALDVQIQSGRPWLWAVVDPDAETWPQKIVMLGTGWAREDRVFDAEISYMGTVQLDGYVWHYFRG